MSTSKLNYNTGALCWFLHNLVLLRIRLWSGGSGHVVREYSSISLVSFGSKHYNLGICLLLKINNCVHTFFPMEIEIIQKTRYKKDPNLVPLSYHLNTSLIKITIRRLIWLNCFSRWFLIEIRMQKYCKTSNYIYLGKLYCRTYGC
jgi:hypothetical protein